ncbi:MAG: fructosamine kinase family protein [Gammaproteobacteria bacterium]|nr:fructosamine kinase family protein [Gammaproteobacteria bacterium]
MPLWSAIEQQIGAALRRSFSIAHRQPVGGGSISAAYLVTERGSENERYFIKLSTASQHAMFDAEAAGLEEILRSQTIRVPRPICVGTADDNAFLMMEYLDLRAGQATGKEAALLGQQLANMHHVEQDRYGWKIDNTIGSTPQANAYRDDWICFWREQRLAPQLALAARNGYGGALQRHGEQLMAGLPSLFATYVPRPSLLHGDLWSGNYAIEQGGQPVIYDPALYFGDRETDLAMTELFGGFPARFYDAYRAAFPVDDGYAVRRTLYNLYHILNHLNLFGGGYRTQVEAMLASLLSELN